MSPSGVEICDPDDVDEDCDGLVDDADDSVAGQGTWYTDADGDTYGDGAAPVVACDQPAGTVPDAADCDDTQAGTNPGAVEVCASDIELYAGRERVTIEVTSRGDRPIQVGSHYPFASTNSALEFDRDLASGKHLDIPAGTAVRFEPGETRSVTLVQNGQSDAPTSIDFPAPARPAA